MGGRCMISKHGTLESVRDSSKDHGKYSSPEHWPGERPLPRRGPRPLAITSGSRGRSFSEYLSMAAGAEQLLRPARTVTKVHEAAPPSHSRDSGDRTTQPEPNIDPAFPHYHRVIHW